VIGATILKDVWLLLHDRGRLIMLLAMPLIFIVVFGSMFKFGPQQGQPQPIAIWHAPGDPRGEAIEHLLDTTTGFAARPMASADAARQAVTSDDTRAALIVPASGNVELVLDLAGPIQVRGPLVGALTAVVMRSLAPPSLASVRPPIDVRSPPGINKPLDDISPFQITVPANAVLFGFFMAMSVAMSFAAERHSGTWRRLLAAPIPRWKALLGKLVPYYLIGITQFALLFGVGAAVFGMKVAGSMGALVVLSATVMLCAVSFGMLIASFGWTEKQIGSTVSVMLLVMGLLGGCMFPRIAMPAFMQKIGLVMPHAWALDGYYALLVRSGTTVLDVLPQIGALFGFATGFAVIGLSRFRFER
jgi:ABC-2 type transport system permease protein